MNKVVTMKSFMFRLIASIFAIGLYGFVNAMLNSVATLETGKVAGNQFLNSDAAYLSTMFSFTFFSHFGIPSVILLAVLAAIWFSPVKRLLNASQTTKNVVSALTLAMGVVAVTSLAAPKQALAFYDKSDKAEAYFILPNESAFFIPDVGANKDSQTQFESEAYFTANKIPSKRFVIPHAKFTGSGGVYSIWSDYYVPTGRLMIVDRTPYNREWTKSATRGTATKNEAFECQSSEGMDVTLEVSIGASIAPENAAKYLYYYGIEAPKGNRTDPEVIFQSVYHSRSLTSVMDGPVRGLVGRAVCREFMARTTMEGAHDAGKIAQLLETETRTALLAKGISLDYIGWAGTFTYEKKVQDAIDDSFIAKTLEGSASTLLKLADIKVKEGFGAGLSKGFNFLPEGMLKMFGGWFDSSATPGVAKAAKK